MISVTGMVFLAITASSGKSPCRVEVKSGYSQFSEPLDGRAFQNDVLGLPHTYR